ncbi:MAG: phosphate butyryltransferase [Candidatus Rifleibacteriota bacterium]
MNRDFFSNLVESLDPGKKCRVAIPIANDEACAYAVCHAVKMGILEAVLIGDADEIATMYGEVAKHEKVRIINETEEKAACALAVEKVKNGEADILMKGNVNTSSLLKAVLHGIRKNPILSHLTFFEFPGKSGLRVLTDAAMCIAPDEETLIKEIDNATEAYRLFCNKTPKVALLAANEKVSEKVPSTVLASNVAKSLESRSDIVVEGPVSFDLAVSEESAKIKKYSGKIQGDADVFVVPRIEAGNALYKSLQYYIKANMGGLVYGAQCPVVLTSRADDNNTKFNSLLLGIVLWQRTLNNNNIQNTANQK